MNMKKHAQHPTSRMKLIAAIVATASMTLAACGSNQESQSSAVKNAALATTTVPTPTKPSAPPQIFVKLDTTNLTPGCCYGGTPRFVSRLRWSAPLNNGGAPITGYEIQFRWNSTERNNGSFPSFNDWTSCADQNSVIPGSFPACTVARTSTDTTADIQSDFYQLNAAYSSIKKVTHIVHGLEYRVAAINSVGTGDFSPPTQLTCKYGGACEFGDMGPGGGIVYDVPAATLVTSTFTGIPKWKSSGASEVAGADWEYSKYNTWAAGAWAAKTRCPGTSCYAPVQPPACYNSSTTNFDTCAARDSWHLPFASPKMKLTEWKTLCNKFDQLTPTFGRLEGGSGFFYWSASNLIQDQGFSVSLSATNIASLVTSPGPGVLVEMSQEAFENSMGSSIKRAQAYRFPCESATKNVPGTYDSNGAMKRNDGSIYHDNSMWSLVATPANLSRPIRTFTTNKAAVAPQVAPVLSGQPGPGGIVLSWVNGTQSAALAIQLGSAQVLPPTTYRVDYKLSTATTWQTMSASPSVSMIRTIGNGVLEQGKSYDFRVAEVNSLGTGPMSNVITGITPDKFFQNTLVVANSSGTFPNASLSSSGGNGSGAVTYSATNGTAMGCSIQGNTLTVTQVGTCNVTAIKSGDGAYLATTSAPAAISVAKAQQAPVEVVNRTAPFDETMQLAATGGSGDGAVTFSVYDSDTRDCTIAGTVLTFKPPVPGTGSCRVIATKAASTNYLVATSATKSLEFTAGRQAVVTIDPVDAVAIPTQRVTIKARGGSGEGAITFAVTGGTARKCTAATWTGLSSGATTIDISANNFDSLPVSAGTCIVTATKAADRNYRAEVSQPITITFNKGAQAALSLGGGSIGTRGGFDLSTFGGSGTGAVTYAIADKLPSSLQPATNCRIVDSKLFADTVGACWVKATKAGDSDYNSITTSTREYSLNRADQAAIAMTMSPTTAAVGVSTRLQLATTGGNDSGAVTYSASNGTATGCNVYNNTISAQSVGTCIVTATKAGGNQWWDVTTQATFTFTKGAQSTMSINATRGQALSLDKAITLSTSGGTGSGAVTFTVDDAGSAKCKVAGSQLSAGAEGSCTVSAVKAEDANYASTKATAITISFDIKIGDPAPAGGTVGYVAATPQPWGRYIEVAPTNWNGDNTDPTVNWVTALNKAASYRGGGKADWRLPSEAEMNLLTGQGFPTGRWAFEHQKYNYNPDRPVRPIRIGN